jgi:hypothetical protein
MLNLFQHPVCKADKAAQCLANELPIFIGMTENQLYRLYVSFQSLRISVKRAATVL